MSDPFVGEIRMFAGNFAPRSWALCDGQLLAVAQNDALFSLLGTVYGGDGRTTFGLPDMRGRIPLHPGTGPGLSPHRVGAHGGEENVNLIPTQLASHSHDFVASVQPATTEAPEGNVLAEGVGVSFYRNQGQDSALAPSTLTPTGGSQSHTNMMPTMCLNFIIALFGIYPSRQ